MEGDDKRKKGLTTEAVWFEGLRNWLVDTVVHYFLDRFKKHNREAWMSMVWAIQNKQAESRAAIIAGSTFINKVVQVLPIARLPIIKKFADAIKNQTQEGLEQLQDAFLMYGRGQRVEFPEGFEARVPDVGQLFADFFKWVEATAAEWKHDLSRVVMLFIPFLQEDLADRDQHVAALGLTDQADYQKWGAFLRSRDKRQRSLVIRCYGVLNNEFFKHFLALENDDERMAVLETYSQNGLTAALDAFGRGVKTVVDKATEPITGFIQARRAARAARAAGGS